jgi:DHA2 family multidrug resistance protein-like MFS transporter
VASAVFTAGASNSRNALGIAILGSIGTAVYRGQMTGAIPANLPPGAADAARDTLGGATGVADQLPAELLVTAGNAFTDGLQIAAAISVVALTGIAVAALAMLKRLDGESSDQPIV